MDFTGGVAESVDLQNTTDNFLTNEEKAKELRSNMKKCAERKYLMSASIKVNLSRKVLQLITGFFFLKLNSFSTETVWTRN